MCREMAPFIAGSGRGGIRAVEAGVQGPDLFRKVPLETGRVALFAGGSNGHKPPNPWSAHVASARIGNSVAVAVKHYLQVTEDHFKQAAKKATHNPTHRLHQTAGISPDLQRVIDAWPALPAAVCHGLLTIIDAVGGDPGEGHS